MKINYTFGPGSNSPKSFQAYPRVDFDLESGIPKKSRKPKNNPSSQKMKSLGNTLSRYYKLHPVMIFLIFLSFGITILIVLSVYHGHYRIMHNLIASSEQQGTYPFAELRNLVMVAGHSVYTSSKCEKVDEENAWYLEPYQKFLGQAASFVQHIRKGVEIVAGDDVALLLFSGGETRKEAGPRSEAQSYWTVAESKQWFGERDRVRDRALTEEHARDSFENLLFSLCRFRELTGSYPQNITVVGYDFKEERFVHLHRSAIGFPIERFFYSGTPSSPHSRDAAMKGESLVRTQFQEDPYGCLGSLRHKKIGRDPFRRSIPYPNGCPEIEGLFRYCGRALYTGFLPWS